MLSEPDVFGLKAFPKFFHMDPEFLKAFQMNPKWLSVFNMDPELLRVVQMDLKFLRVFNMNPELIQHGKNAF